MEMKTIRNLEVHITHMCNLACESCSHYSNQGHTGILSLDEADQWMRLWNSRISPRIFSLLGGEPTIHPNLTKFILMSRRNWPDAKLRIATNGFFLACHQDLSFVLKEDPDSCIELSIHHNSLEYRKRLKPVLELLDQWKKQGIKVVYAKSYANWTRRYRGYGSAMKPFKDNNPRRSWEICPARHYQLFEGKIWKCAPLAYLRLQDAKYKLSPEWKPYLKYRPLESNCSEEELDSFFDQEEESFCSMCSANLEKFEPPIPFGYGSNQDSSNETKPNEPILSSWIKELHLPLEEDRQIGWKPYPFFRGSTYCMRNLSCHVSVLSHGVTPHKPHTHSEEELLIMLSGEADLVTLASDLDHTERRERIKSRDFVYYPAFQFHTIRNVTTEAATYLMFKWDAEERMKNDAQLKTTIIHYGNEFTHSGSESANGFARSRIFDYPTEYLQKLHCHATTLQPGVGYPPHHDAYDVAIILLKGTVETLGQRVKSPGVIFCATGEPHGMKNVGDIPAVYLVFEFHRNAEELTFTKKLRRSYLGKIRKIVVVSLGIVKEEGIQSFAGQALDRIRRRRQFRI